MSRPRRRERTPRNVETYTLFHQTDLSSADKIISTQTMLPGSKGLFGAGIYFANTLEATDYKAARRGVYLIAEVNLGKTFEVRKKDVTSKKIDVTQIRSQGYDSIFGHGLKSGREYVVFNSNQVSHIRYVYGNRPKAVFSCSDEKISLFYVTDHRTAEQIVSEQKLKKMEIGHFGRAYYMFDTIDDALKIANEKEKETYLMAEVKMENCCDMQKRKGTIYDQSESCKTFLAKMGGIQLYIIKYSSLITRIHYCGGRPFEEQ